MFSTSRTALKDVRVLDASRVLAGPFCGQLLGDLGADVIKLEKPNNGDDTRGWGPPFHDSYSAYFLSCNRNKRSLTLDIQQADGQNLFHQLLDQCDILIENFRSDSAEKLGLTPDKLLARHPKLILCSISGFGRTGPWKEVPGYDFAVQAMSGLMAITGPVEGPPYKIGVALADILTGMYAATAVLACLHARQQSGHGYAIDLALLDCALAAQVNVAQAYLTNGKVPQRQGNAHLQIVPYQLFATANGYLVLNVGNDSQWQHFCTVAERPDLASQEQYRTNRLRVQNRNTLIPQIEQLMRTRTTEDWQTRLAEQNVPHAVVWDYQQVFAQEQIADRGMKVTITDPSGKPVDLIGSPFHILGMEQVRPKMPPQLGEQTTQILQELLSMETNQLETLRQKGVI